MSNVLLVLVGLACLGAVEAIYYFTRYAGERQRAELQRRLRAVHESAGLRLDRVGKLCRRRSLEPLIRALPFSAELEQLLMQTDLEWTVASMLGSSLLLALVLFGVTLALTGSPFDLALIALLLGLSGPLIVAVSVRQRRSKTISSQLPEALDMMVRSLRAGHGISAAFKLVATEMPVPIAVEFARCFEEHNLGVEFRTAVENLTKRVPNNLDLRIFAMSVVLQHETGGNLVEILEQIGYTIRERYKFYGKLAALTAEGKVSGVILGALPIVVTMLLSMTNGKYLRPLVDDPGGRMIALTAIGLWASGVAWLYRLSKVNIEGERMTAIDPGVLDLALFLLVVSFVLATSFALRALLTAREDPIARRIQTSTRQPKLASAAPLPSLVPKQGPSLLETALKPVVQVAKPADEAELQGLRSRLSHAGYRSERSLVYFLACKVLLCIGGAAAYLLYDAYRAQPDQQRALYTVIAMIVGFYAPSIWLNARGKERQGEIERSLPDALDLLVTCVEAGLGLEAALNRIASEAGMSSALLQSELLLASREMRAGLGRGDAMRRLASRTGVAELKYLASVIVQTEVFGTSVAKSLRVMSDSMRIRRTQRAEERAATVAVKMTLPLVLCILPALFAILLGPALLNISSTLMPKLGGGG